MFQRELWIGVSSSFFIIYFYAFSRVTLSFVRAECVRSSSCASTPTYLPAPVCPVLTIKCEYGLRWSFLPLPCAVLLSVGGGRELCLFGNWELLLQSMTYLSGLELVSEQREASCLLLGLIPE